MGRRDRETTKAPLPPAATLAAVCLVGCCVLMGVVVGLTRESTPSGAAANLALSYAWAK